MDIFEDSPESVRSSGRPQSDSFLFNFVAPFRPASIFPTDPIPALDEPVRNQGNTRLLPPNNLRPQLTETLDLSQESQDGLKPRLKFPSSQELDRGNIDALELSLPAIQGVVQNPIKTKRKKQKRLKVGESPIRLLKEEDADEKGGFITKTKIINNADFPQIVIIPQKNGRASGDVFSININDDASVFETNPSDPALLSELRSNLSKAGLDSRSPGSQDGLVEQLIQSLEENKKLKELEEAIRTQELILQRLGK